MPQFTIYRNKHPQSKANIPFLLDVQNDLLSELGTRVVIPLFQKQSLPIKPLTKLTPELQIDGKRYILMTPQLAGISIKDLGEPVGDLIQHRSDIIAALDLLIADV